MIFETGRISANGSIAELLWRMEIHAPRIAANYRGSGQFLNILGSRHWEHPLRRPMSIAGVTGTRIQIIYKQVGPITSLLTSKKPDTEIDLLGPIGNQFTGWNIEDIHPVLIGGGTGVAPILNLHYECQQAGVKHSTIFGARTKTGHFLQHAPKKEIYLTTDDGSLGISGTVMAALSPLVQNLNQPAIYACGPQPMLKVIQSFVLSRKIPAQFAVESYMACGLGLCQGCVIKLNKPLTSRHSYHEKYSLTCVNGPVYRAEEICFD